MMQRASSMYGRGAAAMYAFWALVNSSGAAPGSAAIPSASAYRSACGFLTQEHFGSAFAST